MTLAALPLFPPHGLDQTIHVAVLVGLLALLFLTEAFGWVYSGLVVPGYLASVFIIQPAAGVAIVFESLVTFWLARLLSDVLSGPGAWSRFFGRERFVLLIIVSVVVRQASQTWLLPGILRAIDERFASTYHLEQSFSSIGLVLVPLCANMFWKLDTRRGLLQVAVPTLFTYAVLKLVLLPLTNLTFASIELTYENVALDFLASPKAYIILLVGTYLAARYNLFYGWDYSGILIPALLALAAFSPWRLVSTAAEAVLTFLVVRLLLRLPWLRTANLEGPRKIALVFATSFLLKYTVSWALAPEVSGADVTVTDLFGFGYLVPSLIAAKMLTKEQIAGVIVPTYGVAIAAVVVGSLAGFALDQVAPATARPLPPDPEPAAATTVLDRTPAGVMAMAHVRARLDVAGAGSLRRPSRELHAYGELWRGLAVWLEAGGEPGPLVAKARALGLTLRPLPAGGWALLEAEERLRRQAGWDTALLFPRAPGPVLEVPRPAADAPAAEAAAVLCAALSCRAVIAAGVDTTGVGLAEGDALRVAWAPLQIAHAELRAPVVEIRAGAGVAVGEPILHVRKLPAFDVSRIGRATLSWEPPDPPGLGWHGDPPPAVLVMHPDELGRWTEADVPEQGGRSLEATLGESFGEREDLARQLVERGAYTPPSETELRFVKELLAKPLLVDQARRAAFLARLVGYEVVTLADCAGLGVRCHVLRESGHALGWGTLAVRPTGASAIAVEIPRPLREAGTFRLGAELWQNVGGRALLVAGTEAAAGQVSPDPAAAFNAHTPFQAMHEAVHAALAGELEPLIVQVRGFGFGQPVAGDLVVSLGRPQLPRLAPQRPDAPLEALVRGPLGFAGEPVVFDGRAEVLELAGVGNPQLHYTTRVGRVGFAFLWLSERVRAAYVGKSFEREARRFTALGLSMAPQPLVRALLFPPLVRPPTKASAALAARFDRELDLLRRYAATENVHLLRQADRSRLRVGWSEELRLPYLIVEMRDGKEVLRAAILLSRGDGGDVALSAGVPDLERQIAAELFRRPRIVRLHGWVP